MIDGVDFLHCIDSVQHGLSIYFEFVLIFDPLSLGSFYKINLLCVSLEVSCIYAAIALFGGAVTLVDQGS